MAADKTNHPQNSKSAGLQSMTGFARASGVHLGVTVLWEVKSVNGKTAEVRLRLPPGFDRIEAEARGLIQKRFGRGNFQAGLQLTRPAGLSAAPTVNEAFLKDIAALAQRLQSQFGTTPASADGLLSLRGVLETPEVVETEEQQAALDVVILDVLANALSALETARRAEGAAIGAVLSEQVDQIGVLTERAANDPSRDIETIRAKLAEQVTQLMGAGAQGMDEARLYAEAALLATKADIREEIDRLRTHVAAARKLLAEGGIIGRRLDFLAQEFNRESNTLCSKANAASVTAVGLELKVTVDQFREQVQNLE